jgi:hypothetical protein
MNLLAVTLTIDRAARSRAVESFMVAVVVVV